MGPEKWGRKWMMSFLHSMIFRGSCHAGIFWSITIFQSLGLIVEQC